MSCRILITDYDPRWPQLFRREAERSANEGAYAPALKAAGYLLHIREPRWYEHRLFKGPDSAINLYVFSSGCPEIDRMLMFRNWLRANAADRDLYARTKLSLAAQGWSSVQDYADAKTAVVEEILARVRRGRRREVISRW